MKTNPDGPFFPDGDMTGPTKREVFSALMMAGILARANYSIAMEQDAVAAITAADALIEQLNK